MASALSGLQVYPQRAPLYLAEFFTQHEEPHISRSLVFMQEAQTNGLKMHEHNGARALLVVFLVQIQSAHQLERFL